MLYWVLWGLGLAIGILLIILLVGPGEIPQEQASYIDIHGSQPANANRNQAVAAEDPRITDLIQRVDELARSIALLESRMMAGQGNMESSNGAEQQPAVGHSPALPATTGAVEFIESQAPAAAGNEDRKERVVDLPRQASAGVDHKPRDTTGIRAVTATTTSLSPQRQPDTAAAGVTAIDTRGIDSTVRRESDTRDPLQPYFSRLDTASNEALIVTDDTLFLQAAANKISGTEPRTPDTGKQPASSDAVQSPWVINIASSQDKAGADRVAEMARSRDFPTDVQQVTVKGKPFWRVQLTGFSTKEEASATAEIAAQTLGLKNYWLMKR